MKIKNFCLLLMLSILSNNTYTIGWDPASWLPRSLTPAYSAYEAFHKKDYKKAQEILEQQQIEYPNDPSINFNLGTAYYKQDNFDAAIKSFTRGHDNAKDTNIAQKATFNTGNCYYLKTELILGKNWENKELSDKTKKKAIETIQESIFSYQRSHSYNRDDEKTKENLEKAEELLRKLTKQESQNQDQDKKDQEQDKDQKENQDKKDQEQDKNQKEQKQNKENKKENQQQQEKQQNKSGNQKDKMEKKRIQTLLDKLQKNEKELQKQMMKLKAKQNQKPNNPNQKPW